MTPKQEQQCNEQELDTLNRQIESTALHLEELKERREDLFKLRISSGRFKI
jgi:hypothetical protein